MLLTNRWGRLLQKFCDICTATTKNPKKTARRTFSQPRHLMRSRIFTCVGSNWNDTMMTMSENMDGNFSSKMRYIYTIKPSMTHSMKHSTKTDRSEYGENHSHGKLYQNSTTHATPKPKTQLSLKKVNADAACAANNRIESLSLRFYGRQGGLSSKRQSQCD